MSKYSVLKIKMHYRDTAYLGVEFEKGLYILETGEIVFEKSVESTSFTRNIREDVKKVLFEAADTAKELLKIQTRMEQLNKEKIQKQSSLSSLGDRVKNARGELSKQEFLAEFLSALPFSWGQRLALLPRRIQRGIQGGIV